MFQFHDINAAGGSIATLISLLKSSRIEGRDHRERVLAPRMSIPWSQSCELLDSAVDEFGEQALIHVAQESLNVPRFGAEPGCPTPFNATRRLSIFTASKTRSRLAQHRTVARNWTPPS